VNPTFQIDMTSFNRQMSMLRRASGRAAGSCVRYWSRRAIKKMAWETNKAARGWKNSGRLRAGWWPAAEALGVGTVYSGSFGNKGEGSFIDNTKDPVNPSFTMTNSVSFVGYVKDLEANIGEGVKRLESQAQSEWEREFKKHLSLQSGGIV
jgi:hypothetical protein